VVGCADEDIVFLSRQNAVEGVLPYMIAWDRARK
jgi:hypothetical protein